MSILSIAFWALTIVIVGGALAVVHVRDVFKAALFLVATLLATAGVFVLLQAEFLAVVQVLIYAGAIAILVIFAIMVTRDVAQGNRPNRLRPLALTSCVSLLAAVLFVTYQTEWPSLTANPAAEEAVKTEVLTNTPAHLGTLLLTDFVLPFVSAAVLLLAALVGAISLVREQ